MYHIHEPLAYYNVFFFFFFFFGGIILVTVDILCRCVNALLGGSATQKSRKANFFDCLKRDDIQKISILLLM